MRPVAILWDIDGLSVPIKGTGLRAGLEEHRRSWERCCSARRPRLWRLGIVG